MATIGLVAGKSTVGDGNITIRDIKGPPSFMFIGFIIDKFTVTDKRLAGIIR